MTLSSTDGKEMKLTPVKDLLSDRPYLEAREGWTYFEVPLAGNDRVRRPARSDQVDRPRL